MDIVKHTDYTNIKRVAKIEQSQWEWSIPLKMGKRDIRNIHSLINKSFAESEKEHTFVKKILKNKIFDKYNYARSIALQQCILYSPLAWLGPFKK